MYSHCFPWVRGHRDLPEHQRVHGFRGSQELQRYHWDPAAEPGVLLRDRQGHIGTEGNRLMTKPCLDLCVFDTYNRSLGTRRTIATGVALLGKERVNTRNTKHKYCPNLLCEQPDNGVYVILVSFVLGRCVFDTQRRHFPFGMNIADIYQYINLSRIYFIYRLFPRGTNQKASLVLTAVPAAPAGPGFPASPRAP